MSVKATEIDCTLISPLEVVKRKYLKYEYLLNLAATVEVNELFHWMLNKHRTRLHLSHLQTSAYLPSHLQGKPTFPIPELRNS